MTFSKYYLQKRGEEASDYADAFSYEPKNGPASSNRPLVIAISDGASESAFSKPWAKMLVRSFVKRPFRSVDDVRSEVQLLSQSWHRAIHYRPLQWFAEEAAALGAFATLLGVEIFTDSSESIKSGDWSAIAIGDSCLFQVRDDQLIESFPLLHSADFGNSPTLLSSNVSRNELVWDKVLVRSSAWKTGDVFFLTTDALAHWFLFQHERNERPWEIFLGFNQDGNPIQSFSAWVKTQRSLSQLKDDDVTLLSIKL